MSCLTQKFHSRNGRLDMSGRPPVWTDATPCLALSTLSVSLSLAHRKKGASWSFPELPGASWSLLELPRCLPDGSQVVFFNKKTCFLVQQEHMFPVQQEDMSSCPTRRLVFSFNKRTCSSTARRHVVPFDMKTSSSAARHVFFFNKKTCFLL